MSIDNPGKVYHLLQIYYALRLEISTGLRHSRGSVLKLAQKQYGVKATRKKAAMIELLDLLDAAGHDTTVMRKKAI